MALHETLRNFQYSAFNYMIYVMYILYFVIAFGLNEKAVLYLTIANNITKVYIAVFLTLRFNPWRTVKFSKLDKVIAYNAGLYLLLNTVIAESLIAYLKSYEKPALKLKEIGGSIKKIF